MKTALGRYVDCAVCWLVGCLACWVCERMVAIQDGGSQGFALCVQTGQGKRCSARLCRRHATVCTTSPPAEPQSALQVTARQQAEPQGSQPSVVFSIYNSMFLTISEFLA